MWNSIKTVASECYQNKYRLFRLAAYELKTQNSGTMFGFLWNFLNPALQIFVYWFVFSIGLNTSPPRGGYPYIIWMIVGIIPWFYISNAMMASTVSIHGYSGILKRMSFPVAIVPVKTVLSALLGHLLAMVVVLVIFFASGFRLGIRSVYTFYFMAGSFFFLTGFALFASAVTVVFKDFQKLMASVIRLLFYITPVVWVQDRLPEQLQFVLKLNPLSYIIDGYREAILYNAPLMNHWKQAIYFWVVTSVLLVLGCGIHMKFRKKFMDLV